MIRPTLAARLSALIVSAAVAVASAAPVDPVTGAAVAPAAPAPPPAGAHVPTATKVIHPVAFNEETKIRQSLVQVALAREAADLIIRGANVLNVFTLMWMPDTDIVVKGKRIAWVGPTGQWKGHAGNIVDAKGLYAVPGFGESHKHIESSHLTPEWEAALVVPRGNTWTCEASHEFANVNGERNLDMWFEARKRGSPRQPW